MKLIPILYSTPMVQAKQAKLKTQTRRVINPNPLPDFEYYGWELPEYKRIAFGKNNKIESWHNCRFGKPGDILWTRETWAKNEQDGLFDYKADYASEDHFYKWKPGIHMPFAACRSFDVITAIRAERIMNITSEDAIAEGIERWTEDCLKSKPTRYKIYSSDMGEQNDPAFYCSNPIDSYRSLWQHLNGTPKPIQKKVDGKLVTTAYIAYPWGDRLSLQPYEGFATWRGKPLTVVPNPWVWVVEFRPCTDDEFGLIKYA